MAERNKMIMDMREQFTKKYVIELKEQHPDWSDSKIRGVAENMAQKPVSKNTQWNVDVVEKGKSSIQSGKGQEAMVEIQSSTNSDTSNCHKQMRQTECQRSSF